MNKKSNKIITGITYIFVTIIVVVAFFIYDDFVQLHLWKQSVSDITEITRQGATTLRVQLEHSYQLLHHMAEGIENVSDGEKMQLLLREYNNVESDVYIYTGEGRTYPNDKNFDGEVLKSISKEYDEGIINPHINSNSGVNVFDIYVPFQQKNGKDGFIIKEFKVNEIMERFTLSFYNDTGFSYVIDTKGNILMRPTNVNSNLTVRNLFDELKNEGDDFNGQLKEALSTGKSGWAVLDFQNIETFLGYIPLGLECNWYLISIIPTSEIKNEATQIVLFTSVLFVIVLLTIIILVTITFRGSMIAERKVKNQSNYSEHIFNVVPEGIVILNAKPPYKCKRTNHSGLVMLGYPNDAHEFTQQGKTIIDVVSSDDWNTMFEIFEKAAEDRKKHEFSCKAIKTNNEIVWISGAVEKNYDKNGEEVFIINFHDVTQIKQEEKKAEALRQQERQILMTALSETYPLIASLDFINDVAEFVYVNGNIPEKIMYANSYSRLYEYIVAGIDPALRNEFKESFSADKIVEAFNKNRKNIWCDVRIKMEKGIYHWVTIQIIHIESRNPEDMKAVFLARICDEQKAEEERQRLLFKEAIRNNYSQKESMDFGGKTALLVEDNDLNREIAKVLIEDLHVTVDEAENGKTALEKLNNSSWEYYDIVFMDVQMPIMNGYETTEEIRKSDRADIKNIPVIAMTAYAFDEDVRLAYKAGMSEYLTKPIEPEKIKAILQKFLN